MLLKYTNTKNRLKLASFAFFLLLSCGLHAQIYVNSLNSNNLAPGTYYNNNSITMTTGFSVNANVGSYVFYIPTDCVPLVTSPSPSRNYIMTSVPRTQMTSIGGSNTSCTLMQKIQYFDGLGRPLQMVQVRGSATGNDLVQPFTFDQFGRETTKYLPYAFASTTISDGSYKPDALAPGAGQAAFYTTPPTGVTRIPTPQAVTAFEPSPLNRVVEQGAPGDAWQLPNTPVTTPNTTPGHTVKIIYASNDGTKYWANQYSVNIDVNGISTLVYNGTYGINRLYVTIIQDENWPSQMNSDIRLNTTEEYKDKDGHVVLKRTYNYTGSTVQVLSTYYVYDDFGNLAYVLPPASGADGSSSIAPTTLSNLCYQYSYDNRNRMVTKQLPGKGMEEMVYNLLDQVIFSRDANQAGRNEWGFVKYDALSRVIVTGIEKSNSSTRSALQSYVTNTLNNPTSTSPPTTQWETPLPGGGVQGYSNTAFPTSTNVVPLVVNYYDDYTFLGQPSTVAPPAGYSTMTKGLLTATKSAVLNTIYSQTAPDMLWTVHYYDDFGRVTQTYAQHYLGGALSSYNYDIVTNTYDFANEVTATNRTHYGKNTGNTAAALNATIANTYLYDHMGRKKQAFEQINGGPNVLLSQTDYNEIGQVMTGHLHSTNSGSSFLQNTAYTYNERGWLLKINDPATAPASTQLFAEQLNYNVPQYGASPQFNGNIAEVVYNAGISGQQHAAYTYDPLNRLTGGSSTTGFSETGISYDFNGNVLTLTRNNYGTLNYSGYIGNQLTSISGFKTGSYQYDVNGNMSYDGPRGATITYNELNLPQTITSSTVNLTYFYDANGTKLRKISSGQPTDYISGIQYKADAATIDFITTEEGRAINTGNGYNYEYTLTDHLGNNRVTFDMTNGKVGEDDYYPFGLNVHREQNAGNNYLYNEKELQSELTEYDYGARFYDPVIGRWNTVDPKAELYQHWSAYNYGTDNPITNIDPDGRATEGFATRYVNPLGQTLINTNDGRDDIYVVPWNGIADFMNNVNLWENPNRQNNPGVLDSQQWNNYWRDQFTQVASDYAMKHYAFGFNQLTEKLQQEFIYALITGDPQDERKYQWDYVKSQWSDPVVVVGSLLAFAHAGVGSMPLTIDEVMENPNVLRGKSPGSVEGELGKTTNWKVEKLGKGSQKGNGWVLREYNVKGQPTGRQLRWHPGGGHHGEGSYWRVLGRNGDLGGVIKK